MHKSSRPKAIEPNNPSGGDFGKQDSKAQDIITSYVSDNYLEYIQDETSAYEMWKVLIENFERKSCQSQTLVRRELANLKLQDGAELSAHLLKFDSLVRELKAAGGTPSDGDRVSQLFISLPPCFDVVVTALENLAEDQIKLSTIKTRLLTEEQKLKSISNEQIPQQIVTAFATKKKFKSKFNGKCNNCGKFSHKKADCRSK